MTIEELKEKFFAAIPQDVAPAQMVELFDAIKNDYTARDVMAEDIEKHRNELSELKEENRKLYRQIFMTDTTKKEEEPEEPEEPATFEDVLKSIAEGGNNDGI